MINATEYMTRLIQLGFIINQDFELYDHDDGMGIKLVWLSEKTQPTIEELMEIND